jgi:hypothetical protein
MSAVLAASSTAGAEQRRYDRVTLELSGRYMLASGEEFLCDTVDISLGGLSLRGAKNGKPGERVILYIRELGRVEGRIVRRLPGRFAIEIVATQSKRERIAERIRWLLKNHAGQVEERRLGARDDVDDAQTVLRTEDGQEFPAELMELSLSGARIKVGARPPIGARVFLGHKQAVVARSADESLALQFSV